LTRVSNPASPFITIACLGMVAFGIVLTTLGASLPVFIERFGIDKTQAGALLSLVSFGVLAGSLSFGPIVDRRGYKGMLVLSFAAIVAGLELVAVAPTLGLLRFALLVIGFTGGMVNGGVNALVGDVSGENRSSALTFVGAFFGVGAAGVPLLLSALAGTVPHAAILAACGAFVLVPLVVTWRTEFPESKQPHGFPVHDARRLLASPLLLAIGAMMFLESGVETTAGGWIPTLFVEELQVAVERAPIFLSIFWFGLLIGRLTLSRVLRTVAASRVLLASLAIAFVGSVLLVMARESVLAGVGVFVLGAGFASTFPVLFGVIGERFAHLSGTALGIGMTMALSGGMLMPYVTGAIASSRGLRTSFAIVPACLIVLWLMVASSRQRLWPAQRTI